jgi:hypothetical protein
MTKVCLKLSGGSVFLLAMVLAPGSGTCGGNGQQKVVLCHKGHTLEVAEPAVQAHLNHGDSLGPCSVTPNQNP